MLIRQLSRPRMSILSPSSVRLTFPRSISKLMTLRLEMPRASSLLRKSPKMPPEKPGPYRADHYMLVLGGHSGGILGDFLIKGEARGISSLSGIKLAGVAGTDKSTLRED